MSPQDFPPLPPHDPPSRPTAVKGPSLKQWVQLNLKIGALSFGSSARIMIYQDEVVKTNRWSDDEAFQEGLTLSQVLPGPNLVNLSTYLGFALTSWRGTILGLLALAIPGALIAVATEAILPMKNPHVIKIFQGISIGSIVVFLVFIYSQWKILRIHNEGETQDRFLSAKILARYLLAIATMIGSLMGHSILLVLAVGCLLGFLMEWLL